MMTKNRYESLAVSPDHELEALLRSGTPPDPAQLAGYEYRGWNTPFFASIAGIKKFKKGFFVDAEGGGRVRGYNKNIRQEGGISGPWLESGPGGRAKPFGFYEVTPPERGWYPNSILLNYSCPRNHRLDPSRVLRDYVVQVDPDNPHLLLGKAYLALGVSKPAVSWFILERVGKATPPV